MDGITDLNGHVAITLRRFSVSFWLTVMEKPCTTVSFLIRNTQKQHVKGLRMKSGIIKHSASVRTSEGMNYKRAVKRAQRNEALLLQNFKIKSPRMICDLKTSISP